MKFLNLLRFAVLPLCLGIGSISGSARTVHSPVAATVRVFEEQGFPSADTAPIPSAELHSLFPGASFVNARDLPNTLASADTSVLVLPYGSAFPESAWLALKTYLDRGHNLLVLGGKPFTRAAYQEGGAWKLPRV